MSRTRTPHRSVERASPPTWVKPQLAALVKKAPDGPDWLHEIKLDGYRMHARLHRSATQSGALDAGRVKILTRRGNDWTDKYPSIAKALTSLPADFIIRLGIASSTKVLDLVRLFRCQGCRWRGRASVSVEWSEREQLSR
jgi:ATP-dependent DNA ligase